MDGHAEFCCCCLVNSVSQVGYLGSRYTILYYYTVLEDLAGWILLDGAHLDFGFIYNTQIQYDIIRYDTIRYNVNGR